MNCEQILRQIAYLVRQATWSTNHPLFAPGSVVITSDLREVLAKSLPMPACLVYPLEQQPDPEGEEPGLVVQAVGVTVITRNPSDGTGRAVLLGANRTLTDGAGRGVLEIAAPLLAAIRLGTDANGLHIISVAKGDTGVQKHSDDGYIGFQEHRIECLASDAKFWHPPTRFVATGGAAQVVMTWRLPPTTYGFRRLILRRASGSTAPSSTTSGTGISLGGTPDGATATGVTDSGLAAGTYSYSLFAAYNDFAVTPATGADAPNTDTTSAGDMYYSEPVSRASLAVS